MSFWRLVENSPEWVGVFASALFASVTIGVVIWQVRVMLWQGRNTDRHERIQNRLIRLQHEHEWIQQLNVEREKLLKLGRNLHLVAGGLRETAREGDQINWNQLQDVIYELHERLRILDLRAYSGTHDQWFFTLSAYVEAIQQIVIDDANFNETYSLPSDTPNLTTRKALKEADEFHNPIKIFLDLETSIRMEFMDFKEKWDAALAT